MTAFGAKNTDSTFQLDDTVYPQFRAWVDAMASVCFDLPAGLVVPDVGQYLKPEGSYDRLVAFLQA